MSGVPPVPPDADEGGPPARAGLYVMGLLDPTETAAFEAELAADPKLAAEVAFWRAQFLPLLEAVPGVEPSPALWPRIESIIGGAAGAPAAANDNLVPRRRLRLWQAATALLAAASVALGVLLALPEPPPRFAAVLTAQDGTPLFVVQGEADGSVVAIPVRRQDVPSDRVIELWTLRDRAQGPFSLGLVAGDQPRPARLRIAPPVPGQLFEVTLEPEGGSPTGRPTGQVLALGRYQF